MTRTEAAAILARWITRELERGSDGLLPGLTHLPRSITAARVLAEPSLARPAVEAARTEARIVEHAADVVRRRGAA